MNVLVSGAGGFIGRALSRRLSERGDRVVALARPQGAPAGAGRPRVSWDPEAGTIDRAGLEAAGPFGAVVNLAGAGIAEHRWTPERRRLVLGSRVSATALLATALPALDPAPPVFVSASAVGYYGDRGDEELLETSAPGQGFLADVCRAWEDAATPAEQAGLRLVLLRTALVLDRGGGVLGRLLPLFRLGLGARLGRGRQFVSWITLDDEVSAVVAAIDDPALAGPLNLSAPAPVTNRAFTEAVGRAVRRPTLLAVPRPVLEALLGREMAAEMALASQRARPGRLLAAGHHFAHPDLDTALAALLAPAP